MNQESFRPHCDKPLWNFSFPIIAAVIYIAHLVCDLLLAIRYLEDGDVAYFWDTLFFALLPFALINPIIVCLLINVERTPCVLLKFYLVFEQLGCYVRCFYCAVKSKVFINNEEIYRQSYKQMLKLRKSAIIIDLSEAIFKMFTQFTLQIYIVYQKDNVEKMDATGFLQKLSIFLCGFHLIWNIVCILIDLKTLSGMLGVILIIADIGSDLFLFGDYLWAEQYLFAFLTLSFVLAASIYATYYSPRRRKELPMNSVKNVLICVPIVMFNLEPVITAIKSINFRLKTKQNYKNRSECEYYNRKRRDHKIDAANLKFYETILEAAPQLTLQVSILLSSTLKGYEFNFRVAMQLISIVTSFIGFGVGTLSRYNAVLVAFKKNKMSKLATVLMFLWYFPVIVSRILTVGMMASISPLSMVIFIGVHWIISFLYWLYEWRWEAVLIRILDSIWNSITYIFIPDPLHSKIRIAVISSILGIENLCLVFYVIFFASFEDLSISDSYKSNIRTFYYILSTISVFTNILGNIFMILFVFVCKLHVSLFE